MSLGSGLGQGLAKRGYRSSQPTICYSNFFHPFKGLIADLMLRRTRVSAVLVSDEYLESRLLPPWRRKRLMFLPDPWDPDEFAVLPMASAREALGLPAGAPIVLMFGELSRRKGIDTMLEALATLPASARVQGLFAGRMCPEVRGCYDKRIAKLRSRGRLLWREEFVPEHDVAAYFCCRRCDRVSLSGFLFRLEQHSDASGCCGPPDHRIRPRISWPDYYGRKSRTNVSRGGCPRSCRLPDAG